MSQNSSDAIMKIQLLFHLLTTIKIKNKLKSS